MRKSDGNSSSLANLSQWAFFMAHTKGMNSHNLKLKIPTF